MVTLTAMNEQLRRSTALMLGYDYANLSAVQEVRLSRAVVLRLELDDCQAKKLAGQPFDTGKYIAASEALERMLNGGSPEAPGAGPDHDRALIEVERSIQNLINEKDRRAAEAEASNSWREKSQAIVAAGGDPDGLAVVTPSPADGGRAQDGVHPSPPAAPAVPPQRRDDENRAKIPQSYLKQDEPWRSYLGPDGSIIAPWFNPHG